MIRAKRGLVAVAAGLLLLSGCGSEDPAGERAADAGAGSAPDSSSSSSAPEESPAESSPTEDPTETPSETSSETSSAQPGADAPRCGQVWKQDARLPRAYKGCNEGTGASAVFVPRQVLDCSSGQRMITYADHYWAVLGGTIHRTESRLLKDAGYGDAVARCRG